MANSMKTQVPMVLLVSLMLIMAATLPQSTLAWGTCSCSWGILTGCSVDVNHCDDGYAPNCSSFLIPGLCLLGNCACQPKSEVESITAKESRTTGFIRQPIEA